MPLFLHDSVKFLLSAAALCSACARPVCAEDTYDTVTSITTYATRGGVRRDAPPAFIINRSSPEPVGGEVQNRLIEQLRTGDTAHLETRIWNEQRVVYRPPPGGPLTPEEEFKLGKSLGAVTVGVFLGPEAAVAYAVGAGTVGAFAPIEKIIDDEATKDQLFARVALVDKDGTITRAHYRAVASDRSGTMQALYYVRRHLATPTARSHLGSYWLGEAVSFFTGAAVKATVPNSNAVVEELAGIFPGNKAQDAFLAASGAEPSGSGYTTMMVPDGRGGLRAMTLPNIKLTPGSTSLPSAPKLSITTIRKVDVPPFAIETAVTTFRSAGAQTVEAKEVSPDVVLVTPDYYSNAPQLDQGAEPAPRSDDHSIDNLPTGVEIHGIGSFTISR